MKSKTKDERMDRTGAAMSVDEAHAMLGRDVISRGSFYNAIARGQIVHPAG